MHGKCSLTGKKKVFLFGHRNISRKCSPYYSVQNLYLCRRVDTSFLFRLNGLSNIVGILMGWRFLLGYINEDWSSSHSSSFPKYFAPGILNSVMTTFVSIGIPHTLTPTSDTVWNFSSNLASAPHLYSRCEDVIFIDHPLFSFKARMG